MQIDDIDWIDAAGDYMCVHAEGDTHVLRGTMKRLEELLDPEKFVRVHRSTIVNRRRVRSLRPHRNGEYFSDPRQQPRNQAESQLQGESRAARQLGFSRPEVYAHE